MVIESADLRAFLEQAIGLRAGSRHRLVDTDLQLALLIEFAVHGHVVPGSSGILNFTPAKHKTAVIRGQRSLLRVRTNLRRNMVANQGLRVVQEHAVGLAVFILRDLTAKGIWGVAINSRELEGSGINDGPVTVSASQDHRIVGRDLVEIGAGRKDRGL